MREKYNFLNSKCDEYNHQLYQLTFEKIEVTLERRMKMWLCKLFTLCF